MTPLRRSIWTILPPTHWAMSLSGVQITTRVTASSSAALQAMAPRASSASTSTIAIVQMPAASSTSSSSGNCCFRSGSTPEPSL